MPTTKENIDKFAQLETNFLVAKSHSRFATEEILNAKERSLVFHSHSPIIVARRPLAIPQPKRPFAIPQPERLFAIPQAPNPFGPNVFGQNTSKMVLKQYNAISAKATRVRFGVLRIALPWTVGD